MTARAGALVLCVAIALGCGASIREGTGDGTITARVKTALVNDPEVGRFQIEVETFRGVVMLSGEVDSAASEARVVAVARSVDDVREIRSSIRIVPSPAECSGICTTPRAASPRSHDKDSRL